jgi:hypothetical protein
MSLRGHTLTQSAISGTERPSGWGKCSITGMEGSPCSRGSPSPGYLGRMVRSVNWCVGMTTFLASSSCCRVKERLAIQSLDFSASLTARKVFPRGFFAGSSPAVHLGLTVVSLLFPLLTQRFWGVSWASHLIPDGRFRCPVWVGFPTFRHCRVHLGQVIGKIVGCIQDPAPKPS